MPYLSHFRPTIFSWQGHLPLTFMQTEPLDPPARQLQSLNEGQTEDLTSLQTHHVYSTLKRRRNGRFHVVSTRNTRGVFVYFRDFEIRDFRILHLSVGISLVICRKPSNTKIKI